MYTLKLLLATSFALAQQGSAQQRAAAVTNLDAAPTLRVVEELRIGSATNPDIGFSRVGNVAVDREGQLYVFEETEREIRVFGVQGQVLRTIGRRGVGPGEFENTIRFGVRGDTVWTVERRGSLNEIALFDRRTGRLLFTASTTGATVPSSSANTVNLVLPAIMRQDGRFISAGHSIAFARASSPPGIGPNDVLRVPRILFDVSGSIIDTMAWHVVPLPERSEPTQFVATPLNARQPVPPPFPSTDITIWHPDGRIDVFRPEPTTGSRAVMRVVREGVRGDTLFSRTYSYTPAAYSREVLDSIAAAALRSGFMAVNAVIYQPARDTTAEGRGIVRRAMSFPPFQPPVQSVFVGSDASIVIQREKTPAATQRWDLLDPDGNLRGRIVLPRAARPAWLSGTALWSIQNDADDVPWLVKYRLVN